MNLTGNNCPSLPQSKHCASVLAQGWVCLTASRPPFRVLGAVIPPFVTGLGRGLSVRLWRSIASSLGLSFQLTLMKVNVSWPETKAAFVNGSFDAFIPDLNLQDGEERIMFDRAKASPVTLEEKILPVVSKRRSQLVDKDSIFAHVDVGLWLILVLFYPITKIWGAEASKFSLTAWWLIAGIALSLLGNSLAISLYAPPSQAAFISSVGQLHQLLSSHDCQLSDARGTGRADSLRDAIADALNIPRARAQAAYLPTKVFRTRGQQLAALAQSDVCLIGAEFSSVLELLKRQSCGVEAVDLAGIPADLYAHPYRDGGPHTAALDAFFAQPGFTDFYARFIVRTLDEFFPRSECPSLGGQDRPLRMGKLRGAFQASVAAAALALLALATELAKYHLSPKAILYSHSFTKA